MRQSADRSTSSEPPSTIRNATEFPDRRTFLRATAGAAALATGLSAASPAAADEDYDTVIDVVADLGADNTGDEPINDVLEEAVDDDTKVVFPDGEYWIDGSFRNDQVSNVALVGEGDATLLPTEDTASIILVLGGTHIHIENLTIDMSAEDTSAGIRVEVEDGLVIRDVLFAGAGDGPGGPTEEYGDNGERHGPFNIVPAVTDPDGTGIIENVHMPDGTVPYYRKGGVWVANEHAGHLQFERCSFERFSDNALYASGAGVPGRGEDGSVGVENCYFANNNTTAIRLGTPGSYAKHCTVVTERDEVPPVPWGAVTARAGWVWYGFDGYYEDIDVVSNHPRGMGIYTHGSHTDSLRISNCRFELNVQGTHAVRTFEDESQITVENSSVTAEFGGDGIMTFAGNEIDIDNCCLYQRRFARDGFELDSVTGTIANSVIDVEGEQFVVDGDTDVQVTNVHDDADGGCLTPDPDHDYESIEPGPTPTPPDDTGRDERLVSGTLAETPTPTPEPTPSPTPDPTATPEPTATPTETDTADAATPGFTILVTLGALATGAGAMLRRFGDNRDRS